MRINRKKFYEPLEVYSLVQSKVKQLQEYEKKLDYISFVPDGEPTLDKNLVKDLLSITSVHPIREEIIKHYFKLVKADSSILQELIKQNKIIRCTYQGKTFYKKNLLFFNKKDSL